MVAVAAQPPEERRLVWIDYLKSLGIFLVVYGHSGNLAPWVERWIYAFHIPLFFLISGYLLRDGHLAAPLPVFLTKVVRALLPAYLSFAAFNYVVWLLLIRPHVQSADLSIPLYYPVLATFYGTGTPEKFHVQPVVLWFFPCLMTAQILAYGAHRAGPTKMWWWSGAMCAVGFLVPKWLALPLEAESALVAQAFIILGLTARRSRILEASHLGPLHWLSALAIGTFFALRNDRVDMRVSAFGQPFLFFGAALALSFAFALAAQSLPRSRTAKEIASNTILIFPLHSFVATVLRGVLIFVFHRDASFRNSTLCAFGASLVNCALIVIIAPVFRKAAPFIYGTKGKVTSARALGDNGSPNCSSSNS